VRSVGRIPPLVALLATAGSRRCYTPPEIIKREAAVVRSILNIKVRRSLRVVLIGGAFALALPAIVCATPPSHAPAHGWRKKHDPDYVGYTGKKWEQDYGVVSGRCDYEAVGAVVGGVVGGAVGAKVAKDENRPVAILVGSMIGAVVGARVGRSLEDADRACIAHSLELVKDNQKVVWTNPKSGASYLLTPHAGYENNGQTCRSFDLRVDLGGKSQTSKGKACQSAGGTWQIGS
jgi:surface antigen